MLFTESSLEFVYCIIPEDFCYWFIDLASWLRVDAYLLIILIFIFRIHWTCRAHCQLDARVLTPSGRYLDRIQSGVETLPLKGLLEERFETPLASTVSPLCLLRLWTSLRFGKEMRSKCISLGEPWNDTQIAPMHATLGASQQATNWLLHLVRGKNGCLTQQCLTVAEVLVVCQLPGNLNISPWHQMLIRCLGVSSCAFCWNTSAVPKIKGVYLEQYGLVSLWKYAE